MTRQAEPLKPVTPPKKPKRERRSWVIDVCRTCSRLAEFPFCEHRDQPREEGTSWTERVVVYERSRR